MRTTVSAAKRNSTLLQRVVLSGGEAMVALEGATKLSVNRRG
jgi:pyruvate-formate lyase-activating enzyme